MNNIRVITFQKSHILLHTRNTVTRCHHSTQFQPNLIYNIPWNPHDTVWKWAKSDHNHTYFPYNTILDSILFFYFTVYKSISNENVEIKLSTNGAPRYTTSCQKIKFLLSKLKHQIFGPQWIWRTFYQKRWSICMIF